MNRLVRWILGMKPGEASIPERAPEPHPPAGGGGRTPYPAYDVMESDKWAHDWDSKTRELVLSRIRDVPQRSFFTPQEYATLEAVCDRLLPQNDRPPELRIPLAPYIDERLARGEGNGYRYESMPWDPEAYRLGLAGLDETGRERFGRPFAELDAAEQAQVLAEVEDGEPKGDTWKNLDASRFFKLLVQDATTSYYSHPAAWDEIGFQGPASPRGHVRLSLNERDPWEADETAPLREHVQVSRQGSGGNSGEATH